jgi:hypothetical protein
MIFQNQASGFPEPIMHKTSGSNPAAGRGKMPVLRKDGRHPKHENHGRIAGC